VLLLGDAALVLKDFNDGCISLTVTSPPYDNLRTYGGYSFDFETIAKELYRLTANGGVVVWIVGDITNDGDESGTSFKQALYFKELGFRLHDTMIYYKTFQSKPEYARYVQCFDYMFILSKGKPNTFNGIKDKINNYAGSKVKITDRNSNGTPKPPKYVTVQNFSFRHNVWTISYPFTQGVADKLPMDHPAVMPEQLAQDHIKSWSNEGDLILDPFAGSGTTLKAAQQLNRKWIGIEINPDYIALTKKRLTPYIQQQRLEQYIQ